MSCIPSLEHLLEELDSLNVELHFAETREVKVHVLTMIAAARRDLETLWKDQESEPSLETLWLEQECA